MDKSYEQKGKSTHFKNDIQEGDTVKRRIRKKLKGHPVERSLSNVNGLVKLARQPQRKRKLQPLPVPEEKLKPYERGDKFVGKHIASKFYRNKLQQKEEEVKFSVDQSARTEILLSEEPGYLQCEENENPTQLTQKEICDNVDITSATNYFNLNLNDFGPYRINYTRNGRHLLIGGRRGHLACFDWVSKKLKCEINVMEEIFDVQWFHNELMFAVAQKKWLYIYDNQGVEIHCLKNLANVLRMEFLPYHFLLATSNDRGYLSWLDISIGEMVTQYSTHYGRLNVMTQNPYNSLLCVGHPQGTVTMWSPNVNRPLVKMLCHRRPLQSIAIDPYGKYMATSDSACEVNIWDLKNLSRPVQEYRLRGAASNLTFSQKSLLAWSLGNVVEVYKDCCTSTANNIYLRHKLHKNIANMQFCPYQDVLGIGSGSGFSSLIVPGAGEPNYDALECNPYQTKKQRQESEVKALLEKVPYELISLNPNAIGAVDEPTMEEKMEAKEKLLHIKIPKVEFKRHKGKKGGTVSLQRTKSILKDATRKEFLKTVKDLKKDDKSQPEVKDNSVLNRFIKKRKK